MLRTGTAVVYIYKATEHNQNDSVALSFSVDDMVFTGAVVTLGTHTSFTKVSMLQILH